MRQRSKEGLRNYRATLLKVPIYLTAENAPTLSGKSGDRTRLDLLSKRSVHQDTNCLVSRAVGPSGGSPSAAVRRRRLRLDGSSGSRLLHLEGDSSDRDRYSAARCRW